MKTVAKPLLFFAVVVLPVLVWAQSAHDLYDTSNRIEAEADKQLNIAYQDLIKHIQNEGQPHADLAIERLREAQRAWLKYRDAQVAFVGTHAEIGSSSARAAGMAQYSVDLTKQRIEDLKNVPNPF